LMSMSQKSSPPAKKKVPAFAIRSLPRAKGDRDKTILIHVFGMHSVVPEPQSHKATKLNPCASCNLQTAPPHHNLQHQAVEGVAGARRRISIA
jgi:hypothetical protein